MTDETGYRAAAATGILATEAGHRALLQSVVDVARAIFDARAASVFLHDESSDELVFEAVSGEGEDELVGVRFPSSTGIAGWVLVTRQPIVIDDLRQDPRFARQAAERTGYVPEALMAVPLLHEERSLGVLQVLDRAAGDRPFSLSEMDLLTLFANQAAIGLDLLQRSRRAHAVLEQGDGRPATVARIAALLDESSVSDEPDDGAAAQLLEALERILARRR